jgi:acyl phosphate:glycerol-3-phosphate acyltransferase
VEFILVIAGYLIGSIPFAYIAGKIFKGIDIRKTGDGNVGAANAFREIGPLAGLLVMVADVGKGVAAILLVQAFSTHVITVYLTGIAAVAGHAWPIFLGFKGGRGEATAGGVLVALLPAMLILLAIAIIPFVLTRNTLLLGAILFVPLWLVALLTGHSGLLIGYTILLPCMVGIIHYFTTRNLSSENKKRGRFMRKSRNCDDS